MKKRDFLQLLTYSGTGVFITAGLPKPLQSQSSGFPKRPNIIIVMTDDQGYGELGCHGNPILQTPHLDRFHDESTRFTRFFVSPTCTPTRAGLLTGRHEFRCGISHTILGRSLLREDEVTIADILSQAGYKTGIFGKWHLGDNYPCRPMDNGFRECFYHGGGGITQTPDYWGNTYFSPTLNHNGRWEKSDGYCTDVFFDAALKWIEHNRQQPFFALITPNTPHLPHQVSDRYSKPYEDKGLDSEAAKFYGMISNIDDNMGKLVEKIHTLGIEKQTLIIFMTDNGSAQACNYNLFNAGMRGCKGSAHEGGVRVPCFFRWPGTIEAGKDIGTISAHIDMLPTLADLCGGALPEGRKLDGVSLKPLLEGKRVQLPDRFLMSHVGRWPAGEQPSKYHNCSIRSQKFRLVNNDALFDMEADPGETTNVIATHPDIVASMRDAYDKWWDEILPRVTNPQRIKLGSSEENPSLLTCMDWGESLIIEGEPDWRKVHLWRQECLAALARHEPYLVGGKPAPGGTMGSWSIEFTRSGSYSLTLRKLHPAAPTAWNTLKPGSAHIKCGSFTADKKITGSVTSVMFEADLNKGPAQLECWFDGQRLDGGLSGAYFVEVKRN
ncbi:arylsulfatase [Candidatus Omnitrophota bacterium]